MSNSLQLHGLQHARLPCPSPTPGACSNSCTTTWEGIIISTHQPKMLWLREVVQFEVTQRYAESLPQRIITFAEEMNERETLTHFKWSAVTGYPEALPPLSSDSAQCLPSKVPQLVSVPGEDRRPGSAPTPPSPPAMPPPRGVRQLFHPSFLLARAAAPRASLGPAFWSQSHSPAPPSRSP